MNRIVTEVVPILALFTPAFTPPTFQRAQLLAVAAILTTGRRTVANLLRIVKHLTQGASSSYYRVLSEDHWSGLQLAHLLSAFLIRVFIPRGTILLVGDDTVTEHPGAKVHGKARHRDAVRSSHSYTAYRWGHKWVGLAMLIQFPFARRPWALPILTALYRSREDNEKRGRPHKTPAQLMQLLLRIVLRWFPDHQFAFAGDGGFGSHETALFAVGQKGRLTLVSKLPADANLYEPAGPYCGKGRRPEKGHKAANPQQVVAGGAARQRLKVAWYGGEQRVVEVVSGTGLWYRAGQGVVEIRWLYVHDLQGTHRDEYFYSTDVSMTAQQIIERYTQRWNIETTYEEVRAYLGMETTQGWCAKTVKRAEPMLFGLYSVVALLYWQLPADAQDRGTVEWLGKDTVTFSDAISAVRLWLWENWVFKKVDHGAAFEKLPQPLRQTLLYALAQAA